MIFLWNHKTQIHNSDINCQHLINTTIVWNYVLKTSVFPHYWMRDIMLEWTLFQTTTKIDMNEPPRRHYIRGLIKLYLTTDRKQLINIKILCLPRLLPGKHKHCSYTLQDILFHIHMCFTWDDSRLGGHWTHKKRNKSVHIVTRVAIIRIIHCHMLSRYVAESSKVQHNSSSIIWQYASSGNNHTARNRTKLFIMCQATV